jgi:hypothetical protein
MLKNKIKIKKILFKWAVMRGGVKKILFKWTVMWGGVKKILFKCPLGF